MQYNHQSELKKWLKKKEMEEKLLRQLGVDEKTIQILRSYDYRVFLDDRRLVLCQEKVQIKYALLMLSYPAKASALSSNAA